MEKKDVIEFFNECAAGWDSQAVRNDEIVNKILDNGRITSGVKVLDVACGTGVLFPFYLERGVENVTGIDISPEMARLASEKFPEEKIKVICGDVEETKFEELFDRCVVFNAFPHFPKPKRLIQTLAGTIKSGGILTVAHSASREVIDKHHMGSASKVSVGLMEAEMLAEIFKPYFDVDILISDDRMYQVSGIKR